MIAKKGGRKHGRLVIFDVEGVLLPERRYILVAAFKKLGLREVIKIVTIGILYEIGVLSLESTLKRIFMLFRGVLIEDLFQVFTGISLIQGAERVFDELNRAGFRTALISSGLPQRFVANLAGRLKADYAFGLELEVKEGYLTGKIFGDVLRPDGKALILRRLLKDEGLLPRDCVIIVDDRNNLPMFPLCSMKIGYNPDFVVNVKSDFTVKEDLSDVLPLILRNSEKLRPTLSRNEIVREAIHMSGILIPLILQFRLVHSLNRYMVSAVVLLLTILYAASEIARMKGTYFPVFSNITQRAAIQPELNDFATDPIFFALSIAFTLIIFPEPTCYASIAILTLGDSSAMIFGKTLGRTVLLNKGKRVEGSVFGFLFAFVGALLFINPTKALIGAATGMLVEYLPLPISDNLTVPIASGIALTML